MVLTSGDADQFTYCFCWFDGGSLVRVCGITNAWTSFGSNLQ